MSSTEVAEAVRKDPFVRLVLSGALVGAAIQLRLGRFDGLALGFVVVGLAMLVSAVAAHEGAPGDESHRRRIVWALVVVHVLATLPLAVEVFADESPARVTTAIVAGSAVGVTALDRVRRRPRILGGAHALAAAFVVLGVCWLLSQGTTIDVYSYQETGAQRLIEGESPWAPGYPNPYDEQASDQFFGPGLADGDTVDFGFPYPPLSLVLSTLGYLVGDLRYAHLAAAAVAGWLLCGPARRAWTMRAGGVLLLTSPMLLPTVQRGWTETFLLAALVATVLALRRCRRDAVASTTIGLMLAVKQYAAMFLPVLLVVAPRWAFARDRARAGATALVVATVVTLPMALWGFGDFLHSVVTLQLHQPFRADAMSVPALLERVYGWPGERIAGVGMVVALLLSLAWIVTRAPRTWVATAGGIAVTMLAFLLFNKQAFTNYYMLAVGATWLAVSLWDEDDHPVPGSR